MKANSKAGKELLLSLEGCSVGDTLAFPSPFPVFPAPVVATVVEIEYMPKYWELSLSFEDIPFARVAVEQVQNELVVEALP